MTENPNLDDSAAVVLDHITLQQVAVVAERIEPTVMAGYVALLARYFNGAAVLVEQNGQWGGACITHLKDEYQDVRLLRGPKGDVGFNTTANTKIDLYQRVSDGAVVASKEIADGHFRIRLRRGLYEVSSVPPNPEPPPCHPGEVCPLPTARGHSVSSGSKTGCRSLVGLIAR